MDINYNFLYNEYRKLIKNCGTVYGTCGYSAQKLFRSHPYFKNNGFKLYSGYFFKGHLGFHYCLGNGKEMIDITGSQFNYDLVHLGEKPVPLIIYAKNYHKYKKYYSELTLDKNHKF